MLEWDACRAMTTGAVPWPMTRAILIEIEAGARAGADEGDASDGLDNASQGDSE